MIQRQRADVTAYLLRIIPELNSALAPNPSSHLLARGSGIVFAAKGLAATGGDGFLEQEKQLDRKKYIY